METMNVTFEKIKDAQSMGEYKPTSVDEMKQQVDFRLLQVHPYVIRWNKSGKTETVNKRTLNKLEKTHTWAPDF